MDLQRLIADARRAEQSIRAYHGSPHSFSRFDASKIGTGEAVRRLIKSHGINSAIQLLPHLSELVDPFTDSALQAVEQAVLDEAMRAGDQDALAVLAARQRMFPGTEERIRILRKYGLLAPVAAAAGTQEQ